MGGNQVTAIDFIKQMGADPMNETKLVPELRMYYSNEDWPMVRHPLVYQVPFFSWKLANQLLEDKIKWMREYREKRQWGLVAMLYEKPHRLNAIWELRRDVNRAEFADLLASEWTSIEFPSQSGKQMLLRMFRYSGFVTDLHRAGDEPPDGWTDDQARPTQAFKVYRGCHPIRKQGLSWTKSPATAEFFAERQQGGRVYSATCPPDGVLGIFVHRGEDEVVVNPRLLEGIRME